jgi:hypothetical protein
MLGNLEEDPRNDHRLMTLELPPWRQQRLSAILDSIHPSQKRLSLNA